MKVPTKPPATERGFTPGISPERFRASYRAQSGPTVKGQYLHWDEIRRRKPPEDLTHEEWWAALKISRWSERKYFPLVDVGGSHFSFKLTDQAQRLLHKIDGQAQGRLVVPDAIVSGGTRDRYLVSSLMEEAISSSLLEGAATTRREAKELLRSGRPPSSKADRMVLNNYRTMQFIREDPTSPLTVDLILEIHRQVTEGTLEDPRDAGRIQRPGEERVTVMNDVEGTVFHRPPPAQELPRRLEDMINFATPDDTRPFVHPVIRAIVLHFWLAYDHPFVDGNGRTARALFYRSMLGQGYWLTEFLSISRLLYMAPAKYGRAFLFTESDEGDMNYFILHQLDVIDRAIRDLFGYLQGKADDVAEIERMLRQSHRLNRRQFDLLSHALRNPHATYTFKSHQRSHGVVYQTARTDLLGLFELGLLDRGLLGQQLRFFPEPDLERRLRALDR